VPRVPVPAAAPRRGAALWWRTRASGSCVAPRGPARPTAAVIPVDAHARGAVDGRRRRGGRQTLPPPPPLPPPRRGHTAVAVNVL